MPRTAIEAYSVDDIRRELRLPTNTATVNPVVQAWIESAVGYIQRMTGYPIVTDTLWRPVDFSGFPVRVSGRFIAGVERFLVFNVAQTETSEPFDLARITLKQIGNYEYLFESDQEWREGYRRAMLLFNRSMSVDEIPPAFRSAVVLMVRDGFDGIPRTSTERAVQSILRPWMW